MAEKKRLGDLLLEYDFITEEQFSEALKKQQESDKKLGELLVDLDYITEKELIQVLEYQLQVPHADLMKYYLDPGLAQFLPENIARRHKMVPVKKKGNKLQVAMTDPSDVVALDDAEMASDLEIEPLIGTSKEIEEALDTIYDQEQIEEVGISTPSEFENISRLEEEDIDEEELEEIVEEAPVIEMANKIIAEAFAEGASDIHIEPLDDMVRVRNRVDGVLKEDLSLPKSIQAALISRLKIMADLDITERRVPQDGKVKMEMGEEVLDLRVSTLPMVNGEKVVVRLLTKDSSLLTLDNLGFTRRNLDLLRSLISRPYGILLATGPTGSGKTTTLFASLNELNDSNRNIVTIEDPVEYQIRGVNQVQANPNVGRGFATTLRSVLRQDPDIIMVGEIRDEETAEIAVRAALTGHLVLSTLHTNDAPSTVTRLIDMGIPPYLVAGSVIGVVAQRLVRRLCRSCRQEDTLTEKEKSFLGDYEPEQVYKSQGCPQCNQTGYKGRIAVQEVMEVDGEISQLIIEEKSQDEIKEASREKGMLTLKEDGLNKFEQGITDVSELRRMMF